MKKLLLLLLCVLIVCGALVMLTYKNSRRNGLNVGEPGVNPQVQVYTVNRKVADFPEQENFSTPEAAYAVINRSLATGDLEALRRASVKRVAAGMSPTTESQTISPEWASAYLNAKILEVRIFREEQAIVLAELRDSNDVYIDVRSIELENGRWLNRGQASPSRNIDEARAKATASFAWMMQDSGQPDRSKVDNPKAYLKRFTRFLDDKAVDPEPFVMKALASHRIVIMGEVHHRPWYWSFNSSLVRHSDFPRHVSTIYMELPSNDQKLVDEFLAAEDCNVALVVDVLKDMLWTGWPDQPMLDFFVTVWMVNKDLERADRIRIVLADMQRPWELINAKEDWKRYNMDRDRYMADRIVEDMNSHCEDKRNALFIVGVGHAGLNLRFFDGSPLLTAGYYLRQELGADAVYAILPHSCVATNSGRIDGRLCLGLFDSAFESIRNKQVAFSLDTGPFGEQPFDVFAEISLSCSYKDGFDAYLYLGPLEYETFSPLIAGFYDSNFVKELDRRHRIMFDKSLVEACGLISLDSDSFISWMSSWGKPRWHKKDLGPLDAWHRGGKGWKQTVRDEKIEEALRSPHIIKDIARDFFDKLSESPPVVGPYQTYTDWPRHREWIKDTFSRNPITSSELGEVHRDALGRPTVPYKLTLRDGTVLDGNLPFDYDARQEHWYGVEGIDWHLKDRAPAD